MNKIIIAVLVTLTVFGCASSENRVERNLLSNDYYPISYTRTFTPKVKARRTIISVDQPYPYSTSYSSIPVEHGFPVSQSINVAKPSVLKGFPVAPSLLKADNHAQLLSIPTPTSYRRHAETQTNYQEPQYYYQPDYQPQQQNYYEQPPQYYYF